MKWHVIKPELLLQAIIRWSEPIPFKVVSKVLMKKVISMYS